MTSLEFEAEETLRREEAADRLRAIADELARHNELPFVRGGIRYTLRVPDEVRFELEIEVDDDESEIEISISWGG